MINQSDIPARLRLFRYGLIVLVVITFLISLLAPAFLLRGAGDQAPPITDFLGTALLFTVGAAVLAVVVYFVYKMILERTVGGGASS